MLHLTWIGIVSSRSFHKTRNFFSRKRLQPSKLINMSESPCHDPLGLDRRAEIDVEVTMTITICHAATLIIWH